MMKKLLYIFAFLLCSYGFAQNISMVTTSSAPAWSPQSVLKTGGILTWTATGVGLDSSPIVIIANDPVFDFSSNDGSPINIDVTSPDGFDGLTGLDLWVDDLGNGGFITDLDVSVATNLLTLNTRYNRLSSLDISQNVSLTSLNVRGNRQLLNGLDISNNPDLTFLQADVTELSSIDISNNTLLVDFRIYDSRLTSAVLDQVLIDLDAHGLSNGNLQITDQTTGQSITSASAAAYDNLVNVKGWTIDVPPPVADTEPPVAGVLSPPSGITQTSMTLNWTAGTDNVLVTNYNVYLNGSLEASLGDVLTYEVTGLTPATTYNFYVTALDAEGNESAPSNTVQGLTLSPPTGSTITMTTTSVNGAWQLVNVTNSGATLEWEATGDQIPTQTFTANAPTFDFSSNDGSPISITITSSDNFVGLTELDLWNNEAGIGSLISDIDISNAVALEVFQPRYSELTSIDISANTGLQELIFRGKRQAESQALNTSNNPQLTTLWTDGTGINSVDLSANTLLTDVRLFNSRLTSAVLDQVLIDLDSHGLSNGNLQITGQTTGQSITSASAAAYDNLVNVKGWTIDVPPPAVDTEPPVAGVLSPPSGITQTSMTLNWTAGTDNVLVTNYNVYLNGSLEASLGDVLTYEVTGLTPATTYNFYVTALDAEGNESAPSNTVQGLTLSAPTGSTITMTTTSVNGAWQLVNVTNSGATLEWEATGDQIPTQTFTANAPTFDFSSNDGSPISITITSSDNFVGLTELDLWNNEGGIGSLISDIDISNAVALEVFQPRYSELTSIDISANTGLQELIFRGKRQAESQALNTSNNPQLTTLWTDGTGINSVDLSANTLLTDVRLYDSRLTSTVLDQVLIDLDGHGLSDGNLQIAGQTTGEEITAAALTAYNNLIGKGWTIDVPAPDPAPGPQINIVRTDIGTPIPNGNTPDVANGTDFEQVSIGSLVTQTFEIQNIGDSDLTIAFFGTVQSAYFTFVPPFGGGIVLASGASTSIDVTFNPLAIGAQTGSITINSNTTDPTEQTFIVNLAAEGIVGPTPEVITVLGNGVAIANGSTTPDLANDTDFGQTGVGGNITKTYTIQNDGTGDLTVTGISLNTSGVAEFSVIPPSLPAVVAPGANITFDVSFDPTSLGTFEKTVNIQSSDTDENPFEFVIGAEAIDVIISGDIVITQMYSLGNNQWVEVKNISGAVIPSGTYYLALYDQTDIVNIESVPPSESELIPELGIDEVILFKRSTATTPSAPNLGTALQITTPVCNFTGNNEVILISTSNGADCYVNRQDILGGISAWGENRSLIKGGDNEGPNATFDINDWILIPDISEVDNADPNTNLALGTQGTGPTTFDGTDWSNFDPDLSRTAIIAVSVTGGINSFVARNLIINPGVDVVYDDNGTNTIELYGDLVVNGSLTIGDSESLVTYDSNASLGVITKLEDSQPHQDLYDITYWSSPVEAAQVSEIFAGVQSDRVFELNPFIPNPDPDFTGEYEHWFVASGSMEPGRGYAAQGIGTGIQNLSFTGIPNNGFIPFPLFFDAAGTGFDNWNFTGNPYPSAIDIDLWFVQNGNVAAIYLWTHDTPADLPNNTYSRADYISYNLSGSNDDGVESNIGSGQGFMIETLAPGNAVFLNSMRLVNANDQFFKSDKVKSKLNRSSIAANKSSELFKSDDEKDRVWLSVENSNGVEDKILVGFFNEASDDLDKRYDSRHLNQSKESTIYSMLGNEKMAIQGLGPFDDSKTIAVGIDASVASDLTIGIAKTEGALSDSDIFLVDNYLNIRHDLKASDYVVNGVTEGEYPDRFTIEFVSKSDLDRITEESEASFKVSSEFEVLNINSNKNVQDIKVYDMLGRMIIQKAPLQKSFQLSTEGVKAGSVLFIEARLEDGSMVNKKSIKY